MVAVLILIAAFALVVNTTLSLFQTIWSYRGLSTNNSKKFLKVSVVLIAISYIFTFIVIYQSPSG